MIKYDLTGQTFGFLTVISLAYDSKRIKWNCVCECGNTCTPRAEALKSGTTRSCGCKKGFFHSEKMSLPNNQGIVNQLYRQYRHNANKRDIEFNLTLEQFVSYIFKDCTYCGSKPCKVRIGGGKNRYYKEIAYNGIDRIDSHAAYVDDNCVPCCYFCNRAKGDARLDEFLLWLNNLTEFRNTIAKS